MSRVVVVKILLPVIGKPWGADRYRQMLQAGWQALVGEKKTSAAVRKILPGGVIGMKTNCLAKRFNSTPVALVEALAQTLEEAGFEDNDLVIWERTSRELAEAGFALNASSRGIRCLGTDANGLGYSKSFYSSGLVDSLVSRILTDLVDHNLNLPVLKDHSIAGLSAGLKNMYGAIHNPNKFHDNNCDPYCAHINSLEPVRLKNRMTIIDAVRVQYDGGPGYMPQFLADYGGLIIGDDPVATDRVALKILERLRSDNGRPPLREVKREAKYLQTAQALGLGTADLDRIDLVVLAVDNEGKGRAGELF